MTTTSLALITMMLKVRMITTSRGRMKGQLRQKMVNTEATIGNPRGFLMMNAILRHRYRNRNRNHL
jgi:hypothetical protein